MNPNSSEEWKNMESVLCLNAMGTLTYAMICTRGNIANTKRIIIQFWLIRDNINIGSLRRRSFVIWEALLIIDCLMRGQRCTCPSWILWWRLEGSINDRRSTSGYTFTLVGRAVSWSRKKQKTFALLSTEGEYVVAT